MYGRKQWIANSPMGKGAAVAPIDVSVFISAEHVS